MPRLKFKKEPRYIVVKISDFIDAELSKEQIDYFNDVCDQVARKRIHKGKLPLQCVVVENDWPEYEDTWLAIAQRVGIEQGLTPLQARVEYHINEDKYKQCSCHDCAIADKAEKGETYDCGCEMSGPTFECAGCPRQLTCLAVKKLEKCPQCDSETGVKYPRNDTPYCEDCGWPDEDFEKSYPPGKLPQ